ncbi:hypothetical protein ABIA35_009395 [Catenulispora sp. MAP12-49]|uniref:DUF5999 family protein n=1 Tax=unclassified Catenulispora TaxID=414885 RepID=UPI003519D5EB
MMTFALATVPAETTDFKHRTSPISPCGAADCAALVVDHLAEQGWGKLSDGTIVWEDDHRVTPDDCRCTVRKAAPR